MLVKRQMSLGPARAPTLAAWYPEKNSSGKTIRHVSCYRSVVLLARSGAAEGGQLDSGTLIGAEVARLLARHKHMRQAEGQKSSDGEHKYRRTFRLSFTDSLPPLAISTRNSQSSRNTRNS